MKRVLCMILVALLFFGCIKEKADGDCRLVHYTTYMAPAGSTYQMNDVSLVYDNQGRLQAVKIQNQSPMLPLQETFTYFQDSVVSQQGAEHRVYYLNSAGLADSSRLYFTDANPNGLAFRDFYTYNAEGFMTSHLSIFS